MTAMYTGYRNAFGHHELIMVSWNVILAVSKLNNTFQSHNFKLRSIFQEINNEMFHDMSFMSKIHLQNTGLIIKKSVLYEINFIYF